MSRSLGVLVIIGAWGAWLVVASVAAQQPDRVDVLILFHQPPGQADIASVEAGGGRVTHAYRIVPAVAASLPAPAVAALSRNPRVELIEPDGIVTASDAELDNTWGVKRIGAGNAHTADPAVLGAGVNVAIIDSGITYTHPDLAPNYRGGWDFVNNDGDPLDDNGHGTHVAGTVAAARNAAGVVGVAPSANLYALKVLNANGSGSLSNVIAAVDWAAAHGMQVTSNSYGGTSYSVVMEQAFANAASAGIVSLAAAMNSGTCAGNTDVVGYPAKYASVIAVAAIDNTDTRACFSSTGPTVEIAAPGVLINSTIITGGYGSNWNGTSMATPHVSGTAALLLGRGVYDENHNGHLNDEVRNILALSAQDLGAPGRDTWYGFGRVDVPAALAVTSVPQTATVSAISYSMAGGRGNKDLTISAAAVYAPVVPQPGAAVSITLTVNGQFYKTLGGTTDANGVVTWALKNAPAGTYQATVTALSASGLTWDLATPPNSFLKK